LKSSHGFNIGGWLRGLSRIGEEIVKRVKAEG
jgi:hypothetical protein